MESRERLKEAIRKGGSVRINGKIITEIKDLPKAEELASDTGKAALAARRETKTINPVKKKVVQDEEEDDD